ncbi:MAG: ATP-binding cassette domain-containing protein [Anaerolineales bacterium]|nr:ATP-binding cassette domain-containing protein [Anaerolineales bacterium]
MIRVNGLSVQYGAVAALQNISLEVPAGSCVLLTGPSGCGKSTLARVLSGLIPHAIPAQVQGQVQVAGLDLLAETIPTIAQRVGMVFQRPASQLFHLRVEDEVAFGPRNLRLAEEEVRQRTEWALQAVRLSHLRNEKPSSLSGGQKQCLAIAAALAMRPQVLVLDEPTASLDVPNTRRVIETLAGLRAEYGITIMLIEHRLAEAAQLAERVILMEDGSILVDGAPNEVFADRDLRNRLGLRRPAYEPSVSWETLIEGNGNHQPEAAPLLTLDGVSAGFNGHAVIHDVQLSLYPGEFVALVGDNGAGKTTLAMVASGLIKPQSGRVRFMKGARPRPGLDVALLFQDPQEQLFTDSVDEEVSFGPGNYDCFDAGQHAQILQEADLWGLRTRRPLALSVGQQQRTALAASLSLRPRLLILDEPTLGQDWGHLQRLMDYIQALNRQGAAILLISHDYKLVHHYAHRIILLQDGRIERTGILQQSLASGGSL